MKIYCKICNKETQSLTGLASHINQTHNITTKDYYIKYLKNVNEGICPICGKETTWLSLGKGYRKHCSKSCSTKDPLVFKLKCETELKNTGYRTPMEDPNHHQKMIKLSKLKENQEKRILSCKLNNGEGTGFQIKSVKTKAQNIAKTKTSYFYENKVFDSSWELAYYIWLTDNNINFIYKPTALEYKINDEIHHYYPDFKVNNEYHEIKGDYFLNEENKLINPFTKIEQTEKYNCMLENNVKLICLNEIKPILKYIANKYGIDHLKQFKM